LSGALQYAVLAVVVARSIVPVVSCEPDHKFQPSLPLQLALQSTDMVPSVESLLLLLLLPVSGLAALPAAALRKCLRISQTAL
jgi:hypothetical protein